uniref:Uncharacterized protein n=1 Tax=Anguilla anguilla TaxID=7936 RepID=A0A0E9UBS0_ANGAN
MQCKMLFKSLWIRGSNNGRMKHQQTHNSIPTNTSR